MASFVEPTNLSKLCHPRHKKSIIYQLFRLTKKPQCQSCCEGNSGEIYQLGRDQMPGDVLTFLALKVVSESDQTNLKWFWGTLFLCCFPTNKKFSCFAFLAIIHWSYFHFLNHHLWKTCAKSSVNFVHLFSSHIKPFGDLRSAVIITDQWL